MKSIQTTAIILWGIIFMVASFILGQFLISKDVFDVTKLFTINSNDKGIENKEDSVVHGDEFEDEDIISKVGQETIRIGQNVAKDYFSYYYEEFVNYIMTDNQKYKANNKVVITDDLASDYVFYALSRQLDKDKYTSDEVNNEVIISEGDLNSFINNMFEKEISSAYKKNNNNGYDSKLKTYNIVKNEKHEEYRQELTGIENITSNEIKLQFDCTKLSSNAKKEQATKEKQINIYAVYRGGRYIVTDVEKIEKE